MLKTLAPARRGWRDRRAELLQEAPTMRCTPVVLDLAIHNPQDTTRLHLHRRAFREPRQVPGATPYWTFTEEQYSGDKPRHYWCPIHLDVGSQENA